MEIRKPALMIKMNDQRKVGQYDLYFMAYGMTKTAQSAIAAGACPGDVDVSACSEREIKKAKRKENFRLNVFGRHFSDGFQSGKNKAEENKNKNMGYEVAGKSE